MPFPRKLSDDQVRLVRTEPKRYGYLIGLARRLRVNVETLRRARRRLTYKRV